MRIRLALVGVLAVVVATVGVAGSGALGSGAAAGARAADRPPPSLAELRKLFDPQLEQFGVRMSRGLLQNIETYEQDPKGTHLALYVEPIRDGYTDAQYVKNFAKLTRQFVPKVFRRWKALESFDICQEPVSDSAEAPPPVTQIFVTRDALDRVSRWQKANLRQLLAASPRARDIAAGYYVYFDPRLRSVPAFATAAAAAGWTTTDTTAAGR